jgi:Outer membrane protein beta-barrel family/Carboxypeptidase regulatory-like domain
MRLLSILIIMMSFSAAYGQMSGVRMGGAHGRIHDSTLNRDCPLVVVAILTRDSSLVRFTRTRKDGSWSFQGIPAGNYLLLISHPSYADYTARLMIKADSITDLGILFLEPKSDSLVAVIVTPRNPPVHMRGDTLEYNTANVKMKINATVEELLSRLPGVVIDENGGITVNGKKVERLLVDGEDFLSGDPTIVTKNFNADMIARVQVLDKKSSQAEFTGVDDGQRTKTVNLVLKDDAKRGYFVKGEAGDDVEGIYNLNGILGAFSGVKQLGVVALLANNGQTGPSGGVVGTGLSLSAGGGDAMAALAGGGIPSVQAAGGHYADKWNGNEDHVAGNVALGHLETQPFSTSISQQTLQDSILTQTQSRRSFNTSVQQSFNTNFDYQPDSVTAWQFGLGGLYGTGHNQLSSTGTSAFNDTLVNSSLNTIRDEVVTQSFRGNIGWRLRGRKKKTRNLSMTAGISQQQNATSGYLYSLNSFYQSSGRLLDIDTADQRKAITNSGINLNTSLNYTEPLWIGSVLALSYGMEYDQSRSEVSTFARGNGKYQDLVDSLSSNYVNGMLNQEAKINIQGNSHPFTYTLGADILQYVNRQKDLQKDSISKYQYLFLKPTANVQYVLNTSSNLSFGYSAFTQPPTITQLQPVQNNTNPLYITIGNTTLRPAFSQNFNLGYDVIKPWFFNLGISYGFSTNAISTKTYTDSQGRQISEPVNVKGGDNAGFNFSLSHMVLGIDLRFTGILSYARNMSLVGNLLSDNNIYNVVCNLTIGKYFADVYNIQIYSTLNYTATTSSINLSAPTRYWAQTQTMQLSYFPLPGMELNTTLNFNWRQKTSVFDQNNSTLLWNSFISKNLLQNKLVVQWRINNILGQNTGNSRSVSGNTISQTTANIIGRYWMLSATYRFGRHAGRK